MALVAALLLVALAPRAGADESAPGHIHFRCTTAVGPSEGEFRQWEIRRAVIDEDQPQQSEVEVVVNLASLDTGNSTRDRHLRSDDFFGVDTYPVAKVKLHDFALEDVTHFTAQVDLDLHGHQHTFPMQFTVNQGTRHIVGDVTLIRGDYEVGPQGWRLNPLRVGDEVVIQVDTVVPPATVSSTKDPEPAAGVASDSSK